VFTGSSHCTQSVMYGCQTASDAKLTNGEFKPSWDDCR